MATVNTPMRDWSAFIGVGIGTTTPGYELEVAGDIKLSGGAYSLYGQSTNSLITLSNAVGSTLEYLNFGTVEASGNGIVLYTGTGAGVTERVRVTTAGNVGINTTSPDTKLQVVGDTKLGDDNTNYLEVSSTGDATFVGSAGLQFAQIYEEDGSSTLALAAQDTFYQITAFSANGESNGATPDHTNDHITVAKAGMYLVTLNMSFSQTTAVSIEYDFHIQTNNGANDFPQASAHRDTAGNQTVGNCGTTGIIDLAANDTVELWVERLTGGATTRTITISQCSITLTQIGGT